MPDSDSIKLSPLPVPTGAPSGVPLTLCLNANDVYIDVAVKKSETDIWSLESGLQLVLIISNTFSFAVFIWLFKDRYLSDGTLSEHIIRVLDAPWLWLSLLPGALCLLFMTLNAAWQNSKYPPIRFNRQRREVVYIPERGCLPIYVPWESISAGIYQTDPMSRVMRGMS
jgi:hypothetical protein